MFEILDKKDFARGTIVNLRIEAQEIAKKCQPGQFVVVRVDDKAERIPLTIADNDSLAGTITLVFQIVGKSTALMASKQVGDFIKDITGPLGIPVEIKKFKKKILVVGGGTGVAVLHHIAKGYYEEGNEIISIIGSKTKSYLIMEAEMRAISKELHITTDDGSYGTHGFVTQVMDMILAERGDEIEFVVAIGPVVMMQACCDITKRHKKKTIVSLNPIMVDGTGMCGACRVLVDGKTRFACVHGPQFDGHKVDFDLLTKRLRAYLEEERISLFYSIK
jgi:ferredoxin--NADP+ reductase